MSRAYIFIVQKRRYVPYEIDETTFIGAFSSKEKAETYVAPLATEDGPYEQLYYEIFETVIQ